jgi:hypothetical protein
VCSGIPTEARIYWLATAIMSFLSLAGKVVHDFWPMVPCSQLDNLSRLLDFQPIKVIAAGQPAG